MSGTLEKGLLRASEDGGRTDDLPDAVKAPQALPTMWYTDW
jgi:hypothetical protein